MEVTPDVVCVTVPILTFKQTDGELDAEDAVTPLPIGTHTPLQAFKVPPAFVAQVLPPSIVRSKTVPKFGFIPAYSICKAPVPTVGEGLDKAETVGHDDKDPLGI